MVGDRGGSVSGGWVSLKNCTESPTPPKVPHLAFRGNWNPAAAAAAAARGRVCLFFSARRGHAQWQAAWQHGESFFVFFIVLRKNAVLPLSWGGCAPVNKRYTPSLGITNCFCCKKQSINERFVACAGVAEVGEAGGRGGGRHAGGKLFFSAVSKGGSMFGPVRPHAPTHAPTHEKPQWVVFLCWFWF